MPEAPQMSAVICTYRRKEYLEKVVSSLFLQDLLPDQYEVIIVDNASDDGTALLAKALQEKFGPHLRYVFEGHLGLSYARNAGARASRGDIIVYIDDDAEAHPGWLSALVQAFANDPQVVCVAGRIDLLWEAPRPAWFPESLESYLGSNSALGVEMFELAEGHSPHGGNLAIRASTFAQAGGFDPHFGRVGRKLGTNEELRLMDALRQLGKVVYVPDALVLHHVPAWRAKPAYLLRLAYYQGISNSNLRYARLTCKATGFWRLAISDLISVIQHFSFACFFLLRLKKSEAFEQYFNTMVWLGQMIQTLKFAFR